jgi:SAM-dependent methyltransferase
MTQDDKTIRVYDAQADDYARVTAKAVADPLLAAFIAALPPGGRVLDLGGGPGLMAAEMARHGLQVDATDASPEMVARASAHAGVTASLATFDDIAGDALYDGIWANFSLLHAPRSAMPAHLAALKRALKPGGRFHIAVKTGAGEHRDRLGRYYTYYTAPELGQMLDDAGFTCTDLTSGCDTGLDGTLADWFALTAHG